MSRKIFLFIFSDIPTFSELFCKIILTQVHKKVIEKVTITPPHGPDEISLHLKK